MVDFSGVFGESDDGSSGESQKVLPEIGKLMAQAFERSHLVPCPWRTYYSHHFEDRPIPFSHLFTCPVCYGELQALETLKEGEVSFGSTTRKYWLGAVLVAGKVRLVLFTQAQADALFSLAHDRGLLYKSIPFYIEELPTGELKFIHTSNKLVEHEVISAAPLFDIDKVYYAFLQGNLSTARQLGEGPFQLFWAVNDDPRHNFYFVPYYFHYLEMPPTLGFMKLSPLYERFGFSRISRIAGEIFSQNEN